jgi:MSHA biogenesis protein MshM
MYLDYFSLKRHPFRITPDPSLFFAGGEHGRGVVLDALVYAITSGEGILKVVGEVGSGKTMLCRMLAERLPDTVEIVYIANPNLSARDIIYAIAFELKLDVDANTDRLIVMHMLQEYLLTRHAKGNSVVVFIEEAQGMPLKTLEEIRLLSNLETHHHKLMQIVLFGQPELDEKLENKSIRQLRERITHSFHLQPLTAGEIHEYLHFRLQAAGCPWPQLFSPRAEKLIAKASAGLSRRINILADKALLAAYADPGTRPERRNGAGEIMPMVLPKHVKIAIADSEYRSRTPGGGRYVGYGLILAGLLVTGVSLGYWLAGP